LSLETALKRRARRLVARLRNGPAAAAVPPSRLLALEELATLPREVMEERCRALASPIYLGDRTALCRILGRYKIYCDTRDITICAHLLLEGYWEAWLSQFMARIVKPGWTVVDVGANYGYYTLLLADLVGPDGRVVAIEPNPEAAELLGRSVFLNGFGARTSIREVAAGAADGGTAKLLVPRRMTGGAAIVEVASLSLPDIVQHDVPLRSLDSLLESEARLDFLKIDVEGSEERIVAGMERLLARGRPPMVLEFNPARYPDARAFLNHLAGLYGSLREVGFAGDAVPVDFERVLSEPTEWLLFLSRQ
jgi:FkbM family methyltransferase